MGVAELSRFIPGNKYFWIAVMFLSWAFGWQAGVGWYLILLYEKHSKMKG